jgi:hypothetical protein
MFLTSFVNSDEKLCVAATAQLDIHALKLNIADHKKKTNKN